MKKTKKNLVFTVVLGALVLMNLCVTNKSFAQNRDKAFGHGTLLETTEDGTFRRQFSFIAHRSPQGRVRGVAVLFNPAFTGDNGHPYYLILEVTCLKIVGNVAIFGGLTRRTNDSNLIDAAYFSVEDNGEPGRNNDRISRVFFFDDDPTTTGDPQLCQELGPTDLPLDPIVAGNVEVF